MKTRYRSVAELVAGLDALLADPYRILRYRGQGVPLVTHPSQHSPRQRAWAWPSEVPAGTGVADQVVLMQRLVEGEIAAPDFATSWLGARRRILADGERVREAFERVLTDVFYLLDDYVIDPELRDSDDMSDAQLVRQVQEALRRLKPITSLVTSFQWAFRSRMSNSSVPGCCWYATARAKGYSVTDAAAATAGRRAYVMAYPRPAVARRSSTFRAHRRRGDRLTRRAARWYSAWRASSVCPV